MIKTQFETDHHKIVIYQLFVRVFGNKIGVNKPYGTIEENGCGKFNDINSIALKELRTLGITHIWFTGVIEHSSVTSYPEFNIKGDHPSIVKGRAGSPYAIRDYYDVSADLAVNVDRRMNEFEELIVRTHLEKMKVIIDFVPNHVARSYHSDVHPEGIRDLGEDDDKNVFFNSENNFLYLANKSFSPPADYTPLLGETNHAFEDYVEFPAKVTGNDIYLENPTMNDWFETIKLNFGIDPNEPHQCYFDPIPNTWLKLLDIILYWCKKGVDGFRCDMAEMVPAEFWEWIIPCVKTHYPNVIFIAEIYKPELYINYLERGNFDYIYDKVGLYDTLVNILKGNAKADELTFCINNVQHFSNRMLSFIENHDEERLANESFLGNPFKAIPAVIICCTVSKGPVLIYNGQELGESAALNVGFAGSRARTSIFDYCSMIQQLKWMNNGKYDNEQLNDEELRLREFYKIFLNFSVNSSAIAKGNIYDLQYVNHKYLSEGYDENFIFTFLRYTNKERLLIVVNFCSTKSFDLVIKIPEEALRLMNVQNQKNFVFTDTFDVKKKYFVSKVSLIATDDRKSGLALIIEPSNGLILHID